MNLTDLMDLDGWKALEKEINEKFGLNAAVNDATGKRITDFANWGNQLCPRIKGDPKGLAAICAPTGQHCTKRLLESGEAFIEECEAGMLKIIVPIKADGTVIGCAGGCGSVAEDGEVETFLVSQSMPEIKDEVDGLAATVKTMTRAEAEDVVKWIEGKLAAIANV